LADLRHNVAVLLEREEEKKDESIWMMDRYREEMFFVKRGKAEYRLIISLSSALWPDIEERAGIAEIIDQAGGYIEERGFRSRKCKYTGRWPARFVEHRTEL
jgi:hypothetical protein